MLAIVQFLDIFANTCATDTRMALHIHVITERKHNLLDLHSQFTGRGQNQNLGLTDGGVDRLEG